MPSTRQWTALIAVVAPLVACLALIPWRDDLANTDLALLLVLVIVSVAATGRRPAGILAAASAAAWFDFFLTRPYEQFTITARRDVETTVLLLLVGLAVTEIAHRGRHHLERAASQAGHLEGLRLVAEAVSGDGTDRAQLIDQVRGQLTALLGASACRFAQGSGDPGPVLAPDGLLAWGDQIWDVDNVGLPVQVETQLPAVAHGRTVGHFLVTALPDTRPALAQRRLAVALANLVAVTLAPAEPGPLPAAGRGTAVGRGLPVGRARPRALG